MTDCKTRIFAKALYQKAVAKCASKKELKAEQTRERILQAAFEEMYENGYQGMRIDSILAKIKLAKGALYHHFPNKKSLGYAVVDEILMPNSRQMYESLIHAEDPISAYCELLRNACENVTHEQLTQGCPVNNLCQEMSGLDEGFKQRLCTIYTNWSNAIAASLARGQETGIVKQSVDPKASAMFILSAIQGAMGTAKCMQSQTLLSELTKALCDYLESLRA